MKFEVAVSAWPPHKALFVSDAVAGGIHDVSLFRQGMKRYIGYLKKTDKEKSGSCIYNESESWAILADKGYQGYFPELNIITPIRKNFPTNKLPKIYSHYFNSCASLSSSSSTSSSSSLSSSSSSFLPSYSSSSASAMSSTDSLSEMSPVNTDDSLLNINQFSHEASSSTLSSRKVEENIKTFNSILARNRIPVEWFFGRMKRLWLQLSDKYTGGRENFSMDAKIACWLTNVVIDSHCLTEEDGIFFNKEIAFSSIKEIEQKKIREINMRADTERKRVRKSFNRSNSDIPQNVINDSVL
ncbi:uncharacterized protein MONOS_982 [Monocercomonoides exilis]|uniref:uncharacterized protein n=1 Tax=Monocercomonoides exilis TaxID=2049356 RepID=UPI00355A2FE4|nr:hypothetical protein MONOS_982 [Monocercomonoides exilis]|eukprot:MONOS_982.1-p1 / transcript=MONOS_982.1 / gene=MONOS_982 / organism=Monocercomonoides_exilis_PA203 / gene_product=unspecified product / transcript_product=unspecified product / location=Mono_scaffold00016:145383-146279(+) / protein_length=298 / sequence_SO=supercontig / SO=protein_coding / is_pseudo=false